MNARVKHIRCENYNHNQRSGRRRHRQPANIISIPHAPLVLLSSHAFCVCAARARVYLHANAMHFIEMNLRGGGLGARPGPETMQGLRPAALNFIFTGGGSVGARIIYFIMCERDSITARCHLHSPLSVI
jgi:hypothetical protein